MGDVPDPKAAVAFWHQAAEAGDTHALTRLGKVYERGLGGVVQDSVR